MRRNYACGGLIDPGLIDAMESVDRMRRSPSPGALFERELQILRMVSAGLSTRKVAGQLHLRPKTGSVRKMLLTEKLNIDSIANLILFAFPHRLDSNCLHPFLTCTKDFVFFDRKNRTELQELPIFFRRLLILNT